MNDGAEFLIALAQNDYMIDGHYLETGARLNEIARSHDALRARVRELEGALKFVQSFISGDPIQHVMLDDTQTLAQYLRAILVKEKV